MAQRDRFFPRTREDKMPRRSARGSTYDIERRERQRVYAGAWRESEQDTTNVPAAPPHRATETRKPRPH